MRSHQAGVLAAVQHKCLASKVSCECGVISRLSYWQLFKMLPPGIQAKLSDLSVAEHSTTAGFFVACVLLSSCRAAFCERSTRQQQPSLNVCNASQLCIAVKMVVSKCPACFCRWPPIGKGFSKGAVTLAGDAAHPMTPNLGQGGCTALEVSLNHNILLHCHVTMLAEVKYGSPTES